MVFLEWTEVLDVKVEDMNSEHVKLIAYMNVLFDVNGGDKAAVEAAVDDLVKYTVKHFAHEEAFMESIGYDGIKSHKSIHKSLLDKVGGFANDFKAGDSSTLPGEFFDFLKFWLVSHIRGIDKKYSAQANA